MLVLFWEQNSVAKALWLFFGSSFISCVFAMQAELMSLLYRWAASGNETLSSYAVSILCSAMEIQDINSQYSNDNNTLVSVALLER